MGKIKKYTIPSIVLIGYNGDEEFIKFMREGMGLSVDVYSGSTMPCLEKLDYSRVIVFVGSSEPLVQLVYEKLCNVEQSKVMIVETKNMLRAKGKPPVIIRMPKQIGSQDFIRLIDRALMNHKYICSQEGSLEIDIK